MGQYWKAVNLDKREFIHPHKLGCGLKLREQLCTVPGIGSALIILCAAMPERRGGGDFSENPVIGRWAGDRIALVGDYAEDSDLPNSPILASEIYGMCETESNPAFTDISEQVAAVIEHECDGVFEGEGWREFKSNELRR
jgi:hypothetical protein